MAVFDYEENRRELEFELDKNLMFESQGTRAATGTAHLATNELDFVAFQFKIPKNRNKIQKLAAMRSYQMFWEESIGVTCLPQSTTLVVIIGHPSGQRKRGYLTKLNANFDRKSEDGYECTVQYSEEATRRGNSGSPVFLIHPTLVTPDRVGAVHFSSGKGITFIGGIAESIRNQYKARSEMVIDIDVYRSVPTSFYDYYELKEDR
jgi:hypothetical protein